MPGSAVASSDMGRPPKFDRRFMPHLILAGTAYAIFLVSMVAFGYSWRAFQVIHGAWYASFMLLTYFAFRSGLLRRLERVQGCKLALFLFAIVLMMHLPFFLNDPALSQDILRLEDRGRWMMDGQFPYRDFQPNKPPLYIWMVGLISLPFGPDQFVFRVVFSIMNASIPALMVLIGRDIDGRTRSRWPYSGAGMGFGFFAGAFVYAFCPVTILEVGLAGHFDPSVVILTLLAFWALAKDRFFTSGLLLGAGLSLKVYPLFALPIFFLSVPRWKDRIMFLVSFAIVPVASALPVLLVHPAGMIDYFRYQTVEWYSGVGIMSIIEYVLNRLDLPTSLGFVTMSGLLLVGGVYLFIRGTYERFTRRDVDFIFVIAALFAIYLVHFTFVILLTYTTGASGWAVGAIIMAIAIAELGIFIVVYMRWPPGRIEWGKVSLSSLIEMRIPLDRVPVLTSAVILLLLLVSAQFHPWYLLWIIPFLSWTSTFWSVPLLVLFGMVQSHAYYPVDVGRF
jgi:hypothetical protein